MVYLFALSMLVFLMALVLERVYHLLPVEELKRRARDHRPHTAEIYKVVAHLRETDVLLGLLGSLGAAGILIMSVRTAWWAGLLAVLVLAWLIFWSPRPRDDGWLWVAAAYCSPAVFRVMDFFLPVLKPLSNLLYIGHARRHTGLYEKEDLLELLNRQNHLADSRISEADLKMAFGALTFGDKTVASCMTPRKSVRFVGEDETVSPKLMDELHATGFTFFPVIRGSAKETAPKIVATLALPELLKNLEKGGRVVDIAQRGAAFINETCDLHQALDAVTQNRHHLLVVVNNFEEITGVITLNNILEQILGPKIIDEFDSYDDLHAVAGLTKK